MEDKKPESAIKNLINTAKSVIVILPPDPGKDLVVAGISLHLALKEAGKNSQIGCGSDVHIDSHIEGVTEIADTIGSRNLIISFDYQEENLDKVDYDVRDDGKFYLLIKPKADAPVPDISSVKYSYSGANADLVITLGVSSLEELGKIYADEKNFLDNVETISINNSLRPAAFTGNAYHKNIGSFSELITGLLDELKLKINPSIAENLLSNIYESTNNLTGTRLTADTFAAIAFLMRAGAHLPGKEAPRTPSFTQAPFFEVPEAIPSTPVEENIPLPEEENSPVPSDWNKPKIFRVGNKND